MATHVESSVLELILQHLLSDFTFADLFLTYLDSRIFPHSLYPVKLEDEFFDSNSIDSDPPLLLFPPQSPVLSSKIELIDLSSSESYLVNELPESPDEEERRHYRGVWRRPWRKFTAEIHDPSWKGSQVWLGTFDTDVDVAKACNCAAFKMRGRKAILNFPLDAGLTGPPPNAGRKSQRVKVEESMLPRNWNSSTGVEGVEEG